ncbi:MAG TPA: YkgJ family cysteine cluster protein [Planktothrix sp.]|jgi:Fe-S-cluster containining protein
MAAEVLHIPDGINYECTGCGKCCGGWAIPMTDADFERISKKDWGAQLEMFAGQSLFRPLKKYEQEGSPYSHAIKVSTDGHCPFLVDNLCYMHSQYGSEFKPSICQLFPYCFSVTPSGVYTTVSFVSNGALYNSGRALSDQREYLEKKLSEFRKLFPDHNPNWSKLELTGGKPISWDDYLQIEAQLIDCLKDSSTPFDQRMLKGSNFLIAKTRNAEAEAVGELPPASSLKSLDRHLLIALHKTYYPLKLIGKGEGDFAVHRFLLQVLAGGAMTGSKVFVAGHSYSIEELHAVAWPQNDQEIEDLFFRYFYSRIFAKLYFGAGFGQLTMIAGYHHLVIMFALMRLQSRALAKSRGVQTVAYIDVVTAVRQLEKRIGETAIGGYAAALYELLMFSPQRIRRIIAAT